MNKNILLRRATNHFNRNKFNESLADCNASIEINSNEIWSQENRIHQIKCLHLRGKIYAQSAILNDLLLDQHVKENAEKAFDNYMDAINTASISAEHLSNTVGERFKLLKQSCLLSLKKLLSSHTDLIEFKKSAIIEAIEKFPDDKDQLELFEACKEENDKSLSLRMYEPENIFIYALRLLS